MQTALVKLSTTIVLNEIYHRPRQRSAGARQTKRSKRQRGMSTGLTSNAAEAPEVLASPPADVSEMRGVIERRFLRPPRQ